MKPGVFPQLLMLLLACACSRGPKAPASEPDSADSLLTAYSEARKDAEVPDKEKLRLNQALLQKTRGANDTLELQLLGHRAGLHRTAGNLDSALFYSQRLIDRALELQDSTYQAEGHFRLAFYSRMANRLDASRTNYYQAIQYNKAFGDSLGAGAKLLNLANLLNQEGNYQEAEEMAVEGLSYLEPLPGEDARIYVAGLYNALAISSRDTRNYADAIAWYERALALQPDTLTRLRIQTNIAQVHIFREAYGQAREVLQQVLQDPLLQTGDHPIDRARALDDLGYAEARLGLPGAEAHLLGALELRKTAQYKGGLLESYRNLSELYAETDPARARVMAGRAYDLALELKNPQDRLRVLTRLIALSENPRPYALEYTRLSDSLAQAREQSRNSFAKVRFESEQNRKNFMLAQKEAEQKTLQLEVAQKRNLALLLLVILLGVGGYLGYRLLQNLNRQKQLKASFDTEADISRKVHDELANDVFHIMNYASGRQLQAGEEREFLLQSLDQVYAKTRNIARSSAEVGTGDNFPGQLRVLIDNFNSDQTKIVIRGLDQMPWHRLADTAQITCYRALQELLVNMKKHSRASLVFLDFQREKRQFRLRYKDNGVGIAPERLQAKNGLAITENRIRAAGGTCTLESETISGLEFHFTLPLN